MTEKNLFRTSLITLASTLAVPLLVGLSGIGAPDGAATNDLLKTYIATAHASSAVSSPETPKDAVKTGDDTQSGEPKSDEATAKADAAPESLPVTAAAKPAGTYTVQAGDTYGCIAEKYYGSYEQWPKVYAVNSLYPGYEEYRLHVGAVVQLPAISADEVRPATSLCK